jgi:mxaJ protein
MSSRCRENLDILSSRRDCLRLAAASLATIAAPLVARAGCPCGDGEAAANREAPPAGSAPATRPTVLRVCADPNNLPFSSRKHDGFDDKIAELIAHELKMPLEYAWLPQRLGFYRVALKNSDCNLVMAAPAGFERALTTVPYYRSTFVFVTRKNGPSVASFDDAAMKKLKLGIPLTGGVNSPPSHALAKRDIIDNVTGFSAFDESEGRPGEKLITSVATGEIDVAIAWGPPAGFFAMELNKAGKTPELKITPV